MLFRKKKEAFGFCDDYFFFFIKTHLCKIKRGTGRALQEAFQGTAKTQKTPTTCFLLLEGGSSSTVFDHTWNCSWTLHVQKTGTRDTLEVLFGSFFQGGFKQTDTWAMNGGGEEKPLMKDKQTAATLKQRVTSSGEPDNCTITSACCSMGNNPE